ncbi:MAG: TrpB-like pyridoxal phosphate-dependent enzyme [Candidatus Contubernalis sp.]|nr:TrpB-like pyridoxal phosphate-dependent enzyme [Candidatus Contubernalis sp.]
MIPYKILLDEQDIPKQWYNIQADLPNPLKPSLNPQTQKPLTPDDLTAIFPMPLIMQEVSTERWIDIPDEVLNIYKLWRPSPLHRAYNLEKALQTPAKIYYKNEGVSPAGSHKPNTAIAQAYYNKISGIKRLATETGAGQWGSALSLACSLFGLECTVYMVKVSYHQKPYRRSLIETWGGNVFASPSEQTNSGRQVLKEDPDSMGSLGIAISEAVEDAANREDTNYALGSVLNHVLLHQSIIGLEAKAQLAKVQEYPDVIVACCGGGSNFGGIAFPFLYDKINGKDIQVIAVEPSACPTLTKGEFAYDYGDIAKLAPLCMMYTLGHDFVPPGFHAGGLRYHGESPLVSQLVKDDLAEARAVNQLGIFEAAMLFTRSEGILPAPESAHAIRGAIDVALECKESGEQKTILFNLSGHGHFDLTAYDDYLAGKLTDYDYPEEAIKKSLANLPKIEL